MKGITRIKSSYKGKKKMITKADVVEKISKEYNLSKAESKRIIDTTQEMLTDALVEGDKVFLSGFGTFDIRQRQERKGRNPQTGEELTIPAQKAVGFKAAKNLKEQINK